MSDEQNASPEVSWNDIKLFFRGVDIAIMRKTSGTIQGTNIVSLDNYEETVRRKAVIIQLIGTQLDSEVMPKPPFSRWSQERVEQFKKWAAKEKPLVIDPCRQQQAKAFLQLSQFLTGFDDLADDPELAIKHLIRLRQRETDQPDPADENQYTREDLEGLISSFDPNDTENFEQTILSQENYARVAQVIILLWYTGAFMQGGFPVDSGTPQDNQYTQGLVWRAIQAHPAGYAPEGRDATNNSDNFHYWRNPPSESGQYTGLGPPQPLPRESSDGSSNER